MAERACRQCGGTYILPDGNPDPRYCSDRCFSRANADDEPAPPSRIWWIFKAVVVAAVVGVVMFRHDAAVQVARHVPAARPHACRALAWLGGDGVDRLLALALESPGELRVPAIAALGHVEDQSDARPRVVARLADLKKLELALEPGPRGDLLQAYGACGVTEQIDDLIDALADDALFVPALRALGRMKEHRGTQPMVDLLADAEFRFGSRPEALAELLVTLSQQPDSQRTLMSRFFPYLAHPSATVRSAAAEAIGHQGADYLEFKERLATVAAADRYEAKQRLSRLEKGLAAVQAAGPAEKEPATRAAMAETVSRMVGHRPEWER